MPYVANGSVVKNRSIWRLSIFTEVFWRVVNLIHAFFQSMISSDFSDNYGKKRGGKAGKRIGGLGGGG
eukprot:CAMPEP_0181350050 /NCGR_PEP_ID=MMETSP1106-20121128/1054_1 /TAXON_ID=81844 /ORGANISM="Mantoniella antarctica, Strain SL-175" /LENGTH=67 /DNA_ID=CAMNT_0023462487 /DNA_START=82 /DNA_END=281 /DNA_ORIENTATION=-